MEKIIVGIAVFISSLIFAQNKDQNLYDGVTSFDEKNYIQSESDFRISQSKNKAQKATAEYNLGNSIYRQNNPGEAKYKFYNSIEVAKSKEEKHRAYHNLGNAFMLEENYQDAVTAYKNALRNNPYDEETRYNYALAKQKLKENPPQGNNDKDKKGGNDKNDQQNQKENQDKDKGENKDKQDKGNDKDKKENDKGENEKDKQDKGNDKKDKGEGDDKENNQKPQPKPSGANKQQIENLLEAVNNAEKKIQDKINAQKVKAQPATNDKDW